MIRIISRRYGCRGDAPVPAMVKVTFAAGSSSVLIGGDREIRVPEGTAWHDVGRYGTIPRYSDSDTGRETSWFTLTDGGTDYPPDGFAIDTDLVVYARYPVMVRFEAPSALIRQDDVRSVSMAGATEIAVRPGSRLDSVPFPSVEYDGLALEGWSYADAVTSADVATWAGIQSVIVSPQDTVDSDLSLYSFPVVPLDDLPSGYERLLYVVGGSANTENAYYDAGEPYVDTELRIEAGDLIYWGGRQWKFGNLKAAKIGGARYGQYNGWGLGSSSMNYLSTGGYGRTIGDGAGVIGSFLIDFDMMRIAFLRTMGSATTAQVQYWSAGDDRMEGLASNNWSSVTSAELEDVLTTYGTTSPTVWLIGSSPNWLSSDRGMCRAVTHYFHRKGGEWAAKMLAARRLEDGEVGFYDIVRGRFFTSPRGTLYAPWE